MATTKQYQTKRKHTRSMKKTNQVSKGKKKEVKKFITDADVRETYQDMGDFGLLPDSVGRCGEFLSFGIVDSSERYWTSFTMDDFIKLDREARRDVLRHAKSKLIKTI